ncbi:MAG: hypothetical protein CMJ25_13595 [Phycisphaerae bacterium]|nr:hypothetical protein [Phycisphaerae bacterium]|tara:strand:+ start:651 stop:1094 length:444 start_codon:yes stop_codon:yes gene_type:complete
MKDQLITLSTRQDVYRLIDKFLSENLQKKFRLTLVEVNSKRSLSANRAYQAWIPAISDVLALTIPETTRYIKLTFGMPILLSDDYLGPIIGEGLNAKGYFQLSYEQQMNEMERLPVTRLFDTKMHNRLRDDLQNYFGAMGLNLEYKG